MGYHNSYGQAINGLDAARWEYNTLGQLVQVTQGKLARYDKVVAKAASERHKAQQIYERKRNKHITAKKDRAAVNKQVRYAQTAFNASGKIVSHSHALSRCGKRATKHEQEILKLGGVIENAMDSFRYHGSQVSSKRKVTYVSRYASCSMTSDTNIHSYINVDSEYEDGDDSTSEVSSHESDESDDGSEYEDDDEEDENEIKSEEESECEDDSEEEDY